MQLQLIPPFPSPPILFSFILPTFPAALPFPPAYVAQLELLLHTDLDPPPSPYALDKAIWPIYLFDIVTFDLTPSKRTVTVKMIDGAIIRWPIQGEEALLSQILEDVELSGREADRERMEAAKEAAALAYLPLTNSRLLSTTTFRDELLGESSQKQSLNTRQTHRKSKSLFNSLLSVLNLTSSAEQRTGVPLPVPYRCGSKRAFEYEFDTVTPTPSKNVMTALSTSEFTYPVREQLSIKTLPTSRALRRRARSTLVDCFRRWVIPTVKEHIQWGSFALWDDIFIEEDAKWGKMSRATNAYAEWACRSVINRCEMALRIAERNILQQESLMVSTNKPEVSGKESRRSSASSTLASAVSASSRASSSHEQVDGVDHDDGPVIIEATQRTPRPSTSVESQFTAFTRHATTLRSALDRFKYLHTELAREALGLADSHTMAMRILEERGRRKVWSSSEGGGLGRSPLGLADASSAIADPKPRDEWSTSTLLPNVEYGDGSSIWEMSIPLIRSSLGEISSTWDDWQMEWEMEKDCDSDEEFDPESFPDVLSDFDANCDAISSIDLDLSSRTFIMQKEASDTAECHSEFSDSSSEGDAEDSEPSPTSPFGFPAGSSSEPSSTQLEGLKEPPSPGAIISAKRIRKTGVKARLGTYEDVRDELPPNPPLLALSPPPPRNKTANISQENGDGGISSSPFHDNGAFARAIQNSSHFDGNGLRPRRGARPPRLQNSPLGRIPTAHKREAAGVYANFAQSRINEVQAGVFDVWEDIDDEDTIFGARTNIEMAHIHQRERKSKTIDKAGDGVGILEQVGGSANIKWQLQGEVGVGHPPGLHGDASGSARQSLDDDEGSRRSSFYIARQPPIQQVTEKSKKSGRRRPQLTLTFPDPPKHHPSDPIPEQLPAIPNSAPPSISTFTSEPSSSSTEGSLTAAHVRRPRLSAPPCIITTPTFAEETSLEQGPSAMENNNGAMIDSRVSAVKDAEAKETPALLLDTPTDEYPSSTYPYTWELSIVPKGVVVIGTVGVTEDTSPEASTSANTKITKPLLCVTPPPRTPSLGRSRSWRGLSTVDNTSKVDTARRRKSADSRGAWSSSSPNSTSSDDSLISKSTSSSSVPSLTVSSASSSYSSMQSTAMEDEEDILADELLASTEQAAKNRQAMYDGIVMHPHPYPQANRPGNEKETAKANPKDESSAMKESYHIPDAWFAKLSRASTLSGPSSSLSSLSAVLGHKKTMSTKNTAAPPRPAKSLKRSLSLNGFAKRITSSDA